MNARQQAWLETLFSIDAADRAAAAVGVAAYYEASGLQAPNVVIWLNSPAEACYAALLLSAAHDMLLDRIRVAFEKMPGPRESMARVRARIQQATGASDWRAAAAAVGPPLTGIGAPAKHDATGTLTLARIGLWNDATAAMGTLADDELFRAENRFWAVLTHPLQTQGSMLQGSFSRRYHLAWMARDEAFVADGVAPPLLAAAWTLARSAGPWWPFRYGAVLTERPQEVHRNQQGMLECGDGPALKYRDGWKVFAWNGEPMPERWIMAPDSIPASQLKHADQRFRALVSTRVGTKAASLRPAPTKASSILKAALPADVPGRIEALRDHARGQLPLYERYQHGEEQQVWKDLVALGETVRTDPYAADALAVAYETMRRVGANARTVVERLHKMNYRFRTTHTAAEERAQQVEAILNMELPERALTSRAPHVAKAREMLQAVRQRLVEQRQVTKTQPTDKLVRAQVPPRPDVTGRVRAIEKQLGVLPLSLRAFYEVVGEIDLLGRHPTLAPQRGSISPDPLVVWSVDDAIAMAEQSDHDEEERQVLIAPDDIHKAGESGGEPYAIAVPNARADAELLNERHSLLFVDYLRLAFQFGGFAGYEGYDRDVPVVEIEELKRGLLMF